MLPRKEQKKVVFAFRVCIETGTMAEGGVQKYAL
jgi:hypothetical protein